MRKDMHRLLVERGSTGGITRKKRIKQKLKADPEYEGTKRLPMGRGRQYGYGQKWRTDYLAPLRRYLEKQVGRPWNDVYSEIRATIKPDSIIKNHLYHHLELEVVKHVEYIDGTPYNKGGRHWYPVCGFYVCPETGLLKKNPRVSRKRKPARSPVTVVRLNRDRWYEKIHGQWYFFSVERWIEKVPKIRRDEGGNFVTQLEEQEFKQVWKKQLNKKELKQLRDRLHQRGEFD